MEKGFRNIRTVDVSEIHMRDPFVFPCADEQKYYLYGTTFADGCGNEDPIFEVYVGDDLRTWTGPYIAFKPPEGYWGVRHYWAPEVFEVDGKYYMFASFKGGIGENRGTGILIADHPAGPFKPHSERAVTLSGHECLDGTYFEDEDGQRWVVFCHEWTELFEGRIKALKLSHNLKSSFGEPVDILNAATMKWIRQFGDPRIEKSGYLTDAPFLYKARNGELLLLWSSYSVPNYSDKGFGGYTVAIARSVTGRIEGPWTHDEKLLMDRNAGHSSLFRDFGGQLWISTHYPDTPHGQEHPLFLRVQELDNGLALEGN